MTLSGGMQHWALHATAILDHAATFHARREVVSRMVEGDIHRLSLPFSASMTGAKLVQAGARLDGASLHELIDSEAVTLAAGVPLSGVDSPTTCVPPGPPYRS